MNTNNYQRHGQDAVVAETIDSLSNSQLSHQNLDRDRGGQNCDRGYPPLHQGNFCIYHNLPITR